MPCGPVQMLPELAWRPPELGLTRPELEPIPPGLEQRQRAAAAILRARVKWAKQLKQVQKQVQKLVQ
ncbi:MAG: hypothetical protein FD135_4049 [Comamonadaceae bacterium]|nr:MAG: hypothetical protein FD135_4049 [Comamonadaceae bacterium]